MEKTNKNRDKFRRKPWDFEAVLKPRPLWYVVVRK